MGKKLKWWVHQVNYTIHLLELLVLIDMTVGIILLFSPWFLPMIAYSVNDSLFSNPVFSKAFRKCSLFNNHLINSPTLLLYALKSNPVYFLLTLLTAVTFYKQKMRAPFFILSPSLRWEFFNKQAICKVFHRKTRRIFLFKKSQIVNAVTFQFVS